VVPEWCAVCPVAGPSLLPSGLSSSAMGAGGQQEGRVEGAVVWLCVPMARPFLLPHPTLSPSIPRYQLTCRYVAKRPRVELVADDIITQV